jgi:hypothetical protein
VWGKDWIQAKTQAECYDYLFEAAVKMAQLGINASKAPPPPTIAANGHTAAAEGKRHAENGVHAGTAGESQQGTGSLDGVRSRAPCCLTGPSVDAVCVHVAVCYLHMG